MNWIQVRANVTPDTAEATEESLMAAGASAVTMQDAEDQPIFEPKLGTTPLWRHTIVTGLFSADDDIEQALNIAANVYAGLSQKPAPEFMVEILENEDWTRKWIENFKPIQFGKKLWVCPSWCSAPDPDAVNLLLDPGLAFGTGTHPTTSLCLQWLDQTDLKGKTLVDYGCGSGILGIAAILLGAKKVIAIDNDPQALQSTLDNAKRNNVPSTQLLTYLPEDKPELEADILIANILAQPLYDLRDQMSALLKPTGLIAMSGILEHQSEHLQQHYANQYSIDPSACEEGWVRLSGKKNALN